MNHHRLARVVLFSLFCASITASSHNFYLKPVLHPTAKQIKAESDAQWNRQVKRLAVRYGSVAAIVSAIYVSYKASEYFKEMAKDVEKLKETAACNKLADKLEEIKKAKEALAEDSAKPVDQPRSLLAPVWWVTGNAKSVGNGVVDFGKGLGKCFIDTMPLFIAGKLLDSGWNTLSDKRSEVLKQESVTWFFENHTTLSTLFVDLKTNCVPYDLYSDLLSNDTLNGNANVHIKVFVKRLTELVKSRKDDELLDDEFFAYQCDEVKKQFMKKGSEVEVLQNYAIPAAAKKRRLVEGDIDSAYLFGTAKMGKQDIADLCNMLAEDVQKIAAFAKVHIDNHREGLAISSIKRGENKVKQMIDVTNAYLQEMQKLLHSNMQELVDASKKNRGMFTITYEFEKIFKDILNNLHRYCLMLDA